MHFIPHLPPPPHSHALTKSTSIHTNIIHKRGKNIVLLSRQISRLTLIWVGSLRLHFEVREGERGLPSSLKIVRVMLETSNLARKFKLLCSFRKYTFQYKGPLNFADITIFCKKIKAFWPKQCVYSQQFSVPTDVINLCRKIQILKSRHYGGQAM